MMFISVLLVSHARGYTTPWVYRTISSTRKNVLVETVNIFKKKYDYGNLEYFNKGGFKLSYSNNNFIEFQSPSYIRTSYDIYKDGVISFVLFVSEQEHGSFVETSSKIEYSYTEKKTRKVCLIKEIKKRDLNPAAVMRLWLRKFETIRTTSAEHGALS